MQQTLPQEKCSIVKTICWTIKKKKISTNYLRIYSFVQIIMEAHMSCARTLGNCKINSI